MCSKQYNSPLEIYSEEALEEIMKEGTLKWVHWKDTDFFKIVKICVQKNVSFFPFSGKPFDISNLMNPSGKDFDEKESAVLAMILANSNKNKKPWFRSLFLRSKVKTCYFLHSLITIHGPASHFIIP